MFGTRIKKILHRTYRHWLKKINLKKNQIKIKVKNWLIKVEVILIIKKNHLIKVIKNWFYSYNEKEEIGIIYLI